VTPVLTGPFPYFSLPLPLISVLYPTSRPGTSVIEFNEPVVPLKGIPKSLALGLYSCCDLTGGAIKNNASAKIKMGSVLFII
jgi:hypothetical protein